MIEGISDGPQNVHIVMINIFRTSKVSVETSPVSLLHHKALLSFVIPQIHEVLLHAGMQTRDSGVLSTPAGYYAQDGANCWSSSHSTRGCYPQDGANCWCRMCTVHYETPTCIEATTATTFFNGDT